MKNQSLRQRIIEAAFRLFDERGIQHVSMDAVAEAAETTKMGVYRHFSSRDVLVDQWLSATIAKYRGVLDEIECLYPEDPHAQLREWITHVLEGLPTISHRGCPFVNTVAEVSDPEHPLRQKIRGHKLEQVERLKALCMKAGLSNPNAAAAQITFLLEGAQVAAQNGSLPAIEKSLATLTRQILSERE
ncbi:TetR/AcrR family transcriptional regulator [Tritonibacter mobilis]|uniref:TetR/AcrR family transcriptional regulator n=1 Tax=Tritonibacter mobilis TaxID=379347 RepID=UPI001C0A43DA|nr:TetR/AcrR family transcriptional regulator [Tritonibacter mobilis]MBU3033936.1 TetR/AcrR family transcriptional regulator [Tritonibacter mobilis]WHQ84984.1 TetR/AcrR family transcriptional regulator [Tritonibacter mobilis]